MAMLRPASARDLRLDVLRGLCLLDMVLVHLLEQHVHTPWIVGEAVMHWLRFAAGGFVLTSGLCVGAIHYERALDAGRRGKTYVALLKRAAFVLGVHYFASILSLVLIPIQGRPVFDVGGMLWGILTLRAGYDLLLFYVFMLAVAPLVIEAVRRVGPAAVLAASVGVFFWKYDDPYLSLWPIERDFPLLRWQLIFVTGLVIGSRLKAYDALPVGLKWRLLAGAAACALAIDGLSAAERAGELVLPWWLTVTKLPLSPLEVLRYVSLAVVAGVALDRAWRWLGPSTAGRVVAAVGVQSLMLWVAHVPIVANVVPLPWPLAMAAAWAAVWAVAALGTKLTATWNAGLPAWPRFAYVVPAVGSVLVAVTLWRLELPRTTDTPLAAGVATDESIFFDGDDSPIPLDDDIVGEAA